MLANILIALYIVKQKKSEKILDAKIAKGTHAIKGYANSYNVEILNSFNPELQLKGTETAIKNKLIDLLTELKGFKFVTTLALEFKKIENDGKTENSTFYLASKEEANNMTPFIQTEKQKQILMKKTLIIYLNQSILLLYQTYKSL